MAVTHTGSINWKSNMWGTTIKLSFIQSNSFQYNIFKRPIEIFFFILFYFRTWAASFMCPCIVTIHFYTRQHVWWGSCPLIVCASNSWTYRHLLSLLPTNVILPINFVRIRFIYLPAFTIAPNYSLWQIPSGKKREQFSLVDVLDLEIQSWKRWLQKL